MIPNQRPLFRGLSLFLFIFIFSSLSAFSQNKEYRPRYPLQISSEDENDLLLSDKIITTRSASINEINQLLFSLQNSDSGLVICRAFNALAHLPSFPNEAFQVVSQFQNSSNDQIRMELTLLFGWFASPQFFPIIYHLLNDPVGSVSSNALFVLHRFGIESLSGLSFLGNALALLKKTTLKVENFPHYQVLFSKIPSFCLSVTANGLGFIAPYYPLSDCCKFSDYFESIPALPLYQKKNPIPFQPSPKPVSTPIQNKLQFPPEKNIQVSRFQMKEIQLKDAFALLETISNQKIVVSNEVKCSVTFDFKEARVAEIITNLIASYSLKSSWQGGSLLIENTRK